MKAAFIGIGHVGYAIADILQSKGLQIIVATDNPESDSAREALEKNPEWKIFPLQSAVDEAEIVFLATPFQVIEKILRKIRFSGKTLVDCTNPVGPGVSHGLKSETSGAEEVQKLAPDAKVVKAFNIYGYENFDVSLFRSYDVKPVMLIAGNDEKSKQQVSMLIREMGFEVKDTGALSMSLHLEHMTLLWVKMVRMGGHPHFVWTYLER
jgi:hypothetical protein